MNFCETEWHIIANPNAMTEQRALLKKKILTEFDNIGIRYTLHIADGAGSGMAVAEQLCCTGIRHLIVVGGDGSINEVVNGIYRSNANPEEVYLAIIPLGTGNDFCRTLHYPAIRSIVPFLQTSCFRLTDVGIVTITNSKNTTVQQRYFINIAGFGFDAAVIKETVNGKPKLFPAAIYLLKLIKVLFHYKATTVRFRTDVGNTEEQIFTIAVGNAQYNGNGMRQVPMADPHDRKLDLVAIRAISPWKTIANVKNLFAGKHIHLPEVTVVRTEQVEISAEQPIFGEVEGEMLPHGNYHIGLAPFQLNVLQSAY